MDFPKQEIEAANKRATARLAKTPLATAAHYDRRLDRLFIDLSCGLSIAFNPQHAQGLESAKPDQLKKIEISPSGLGLHFPTMDADIYLPALLEGFLGSRRWMTAQSARLAAAPHLTPKQTPFKLTVNLAAVPKKFMPTEHEEKVYWSNQCESNAKC
jgi:hypothetical protein